MGIDKIRKRKKKTKKYKKRIPFWAGGESYGGDPSAGADDGGPGSGPSGPDGPSNGSDNSEPGVSPTPTPTTNFSDNSEPGVSPTPTVNFSDTNEPGVSPVATTSLLYDGPTYDEEVGINTPPTTPVNFSDTNEPGINPGLYNPPAYTDGPTYDEEVGIYNAPTFKNPDYDDNQKALSYIEPIEEPKGGFFDSGIGKFIKNIGKGALYTLAPAVGLGKVAKAYKTYNTLKTGLGYADKLTKGRLTGLAKNLNLNSNINSTPGTGGTKPTTGFNDNDNNEGNALVANNVIAKSVQEYSPAQVKSLQNNINLLSSVMDKGQYQGIQLNSSQLSQVSNQRNSLIEQYKTIQESLV